MHHGLFWGEPKAITNNHGQIVKKLIDNNLNLYAVHLPLDSHCKVGHNFSMATLLQFRKC